MTDMEQREAAHQFVNKWHGRGKRMEMDALTGSIYQFYPVYLADEKENHDFESHALKDYKRVLIELFKILDIFVKERKEYLEEEPAQFHYANRGIFTDERIEIPPVTKEIRQQILNKTYGDFSWSDILLQYLELSLNLL